MENDITIHGYPTPRSELRRQAVTDPVGAANRLAELEAGLRLIAEWARPQGKLARQPHDYERVLSKISEIVTHVLGDKETR